METIATILFWIGTILIIASYVAGVIGGIRVHENEDFGLGCGYGFCGLIGVAVGHAIIGIGDLAYMSNEKKIELAQETLKNDGEVLIIKNHKDSLVTIHNSSVNILNNIRKVQSIIADLKKKSENVSSDSSKKIFINKIENLTIQVHKLQDSLKKLESCAFEQVLLNHTRKFAGVETENANLSPNIAKELDAVRQVMQEVDNISSL